MAPKQCYPLTTKMKIVLLVFTLFWGVTASANNDDVLEVEKDGLVVNVVDFKDGDKIKLFEAETGEHILSKSIGQIDLSMLPNGKYLLENNEGKSVIIERTGDEIIVEDMLTDEYVVEKDSDIIQEEQIAMEKQLERFYHQGSSKILSIAREGDIVTVLDFQEGDEIKLFEVKDTVHILSKTEGFVDLSQLPVGVYFIENNRGESVIVEKLVDKGEMMAADTN